VILIYQLTVFHFDMRHLHAWKEVQNLTAYSEAFTWRLRLCVNGVTFGVSYTILMLDVVHYLMYRRTWFRLHHVVLRMHHMFIMFFLMFCWPCISIYACNETNLMHYLSSDYSVTMPLHVSGLLVAHHQEVTMYICDNSYVLYFPGLARLSFW
jgi:hypothetical protein